jgi:spore coat polysaccharide biosynthesis protein SpsF
MSDRVGIVLQARMRSSRLPGKALLCVGGRSILEHCIRRLRHAAVAPVIVATSTGQEDDSIAAAAEACGAHSWRGPLDDVLTRVLQVAARFELDLVVRATADNPAVDIDAPRRVASRLQDTGADYACEQGLPYGAAVEAVRVEALRQSLSLATEADREHVTTAVRRHADRFALQLPWAPVPLRRPELRFTVDTETDLTYLRHVFDAVGTSVDPVPLTCLITAADYLAAREVAA